MIKEKFIIKTKKALTKQQRITSGLPRPQQMNTTDCRSLHIQSCIEPQYTYFMKISLLKEKTNITVEIKNDTSVLVLNAYKLFNLKASIYGEHNEENLAIREARFDVIEITMSEPLKAGLSYILWMEFEGNITDDLVGIYRSSYTDRNNQTAYMIATHFEAVKARRAFPCWDEPIFKAVFEITLITPDNATVLGNTAISTRTSNPENPSEVIVKFEPTLKMPTYLIAFAVGDMDYVEGYDIYSTRHRVYTPVYRSQDGLYALNVSIKSIEYLSAYFKQLYPLSKLDSLALKDFQIGAMENWGLVTYREARLLVGEGSSFSTKFSAANTICHENSHMWFGDLVSAGWWSDLWLKEGFATWAAYKVEDILFPEYETWMQFMVNNFLTAIVADAKESTHKIVVDVPNTDSVDSIFDAISYRKGASIIRMLEEYVGANIFRTALQDYMQTYAYKNAYTTDLWTSISKAYGQEIGPMINTWTNQPGFPYISLNVQKSGFYITKYDESMLTKLKNAVLNQQLHSLDRLDLESDLNMLGTAGLEPMSKYLEFLFSYINETDYTIWNDITNNLFTLNGIMEYMNLETNLTTYVQKLYANVLEYVGWDAKPEEPETLASLRSIVLRQLGLFGHQETIQKMRSLFEIVVNDPNYMPNLRNTILIVNIRNGGVNEYNLVKQSFFNAATSEEEVNALTALGYTADPGCAHDLTAFASLSGQVRTQDVFYPLRALGYSKLGRDIIWSYMKANITELMQRFSLGFFMDSYIARSLNKFAFAEMINEMTTFFEQNGIPTDDLIITNMMEEIQIRSNVVNRSREDLGAYLGSISGLHAYEQK